MNTTPATRPFSWAILATLRHETCPTCPTRPPLDGPRDGFGAAHDPACPRVVRKVGDK